MSKDTVNGSPVMQRGRQLDEYKKSMKERERERKKMRHNRCVRKKDEGLEVLRS